MENNDSLSAIRLAEIYSNEDKLNFELSWTYLAFGLSLLELQYGIRNFKK